MLTGLSAKPIRSENLVYTTLIRYKQYLHRIFTQFTEKNGKNVFKKFKIASFLKKKKENNIQN